MTLLTFIFGFIIGVVVTCFGVYKSLRDASETGELFAEHFRVTYTSEY